MGGENLSYFFENSIRDVTNFSSAADDIFGILEAFKSRSDCNNPVSPLEGSAAAGLAASRDAEESNQSFEFQKSACSPWIAYQESETEIEPASPNCKRQKMNDVATASASHLEEDERKNSHIRVERNRRKQMNEHLSVLRSLMPCFYVKRGDQASIIGGVINYINELQQVLQSLQAKKRRKAYTDVLSPRPSLPISPSTPQPSSTYKPRMHNLQTGSYVKSPSLPSPLEFSPCNSATSSINDGVNELVASTKSAVAEVEVKFSGSNLLLKTASHRIPGQAARIVSALDELALEILQVDINTVDETMLNSFTIKIGIDCQLSAEELAQLIQQTFC